MAKAVAFSRPEDRADVEGGAHIVEQTLQSLNLKYRGRA